MDENKKQILRYKNNVKKLLRMKNVKTENGITTIQGFVHGWVQPDNGCGFLVQVKVEKEGEKNDEIVEVLVDVKGALKIGQYSEKGISCGYGDIKSLELVEIKGYVIPDMIVKDYPYVFMIAESVSGTGNIISRSIMGEGDIDIEIESIDITLDALTKYAQHPRGSKDLYDLRQPYINDLFSKLGVKGFIIFTLEKNGKINMYGKGELYAKNIRNIGYQLIEMTDKNNPDYVWFFDPEY